MSYYEEPYTFDSEDGGFDDESENVDSNWFGASPNCGSSRKPRQLEDKDGVYWKCPACKSEHDNRDSLTGGF